jgi:hypothetical protein
MGLQESVKWEQPTPVTLSEALRLLDQLEAKLERRERALRASAFECARRYVTEMAASGGITGPRNKTCPSREGFRRRVDVQVWQGRAFIHDSI